MLVYFCKYFNHLAIIRKNSLKMKPTETNSKTKSWKELRSLRTLLSFWSDCDLSNDKFTEVMNSIISSSWPFSVAYSQRHYTKLKEMATSWPQIPVCSRNATWHMYKEHQQQSDTGIWIIQTLPGTVWTWISHLNSKPQVSVNKGTIATTLQSMWKDSVREGMQSVLGK